MSTTKPTNASPDEVQTVITALRELHEKMTFLTPLSQEQRHELRGVRFGPSTWHVLQGRVEAAREHRDLLPPAFDLRKLERDMEFAGGLQSCLARLDQMRDGVGDTLLAVGSRAVLAGAVAHGHINVATAAEHPARRTVVTLGPRRSRARRTNPAPSPTPPTAETKAEQASASSPAPAAGPAPTPSPAGPKQDAA